MVIPWFSYPKNCMEEHMLRWRTSLFVCLLAAGFPIVAHAHDAILVIADPANNRAYIPEGTILPPGLEVRAQRTGIRRLVNGKVERPIDLSAQGFKRLTTPPLVFEYAPAERFDEVRKRYEAQQVARRSPRVKATSHDGDACQHFYVSGSNTGVYGTYTNGFTSSYCPPPGGGQRVVGQSYLWQFVAIGDYSDDDQYISPYVAIGDNNGNFSCFNDTVFSCTASATTPWSGYFCQNTVYTSAVLYVIEYAPQNQYDYYVGWNFQINHCTGFY
jgi:hypothetical protein